MFSPEMGTSCDSYSSRPERVKAGSLLTQTLNSTVDDISVNTSKVQILELTSDMTMDKSLNDTSHHVMLNDIEEVINDTETSSAFLSSNGAESSPDGGTSPPIKASKIRTNSVSASPFNIFAQNCLQVQP